VDPGDDYLIALAAAARAVIVSGDRHLLDMRDELPVQSPAGFLAAIESGD
jgi:predicted nucleic acid-binding protein